MSGEECPWRGSAYQANLYECQTDTSLEQMYLEEQETQAETEEPQPEEQ